MYNSDLCKQKLRKNKKVFKNIILIFIVILPFYLIALKIGIIPYSKLYIKSSFVINKSNFEYIAKNIPRESGSNISYFVGNKVPYKYGDESINVLNDKELIECAKKVMKGCNYSEISCYTYYDFSVVEFVPDNFNLRNGRGLIYCEQPLEDYDDPCGYSYRFRYESLGDGWYYYYSNYPFGNQE